MRPPGSAALLCGRGNGGVGGMATKAAARECGAPGLLLLMLCAVLDAADGTVTFSDGTAWTGTIALASGAKLTLHDGKAVRTLDPAQVAELVFAPRAESMERAFSMPEPGKPIRVETGEPYPLRQLAVRVRLGDGTSLAGNLYATALTVLVGEEKRKLPLPSKQRGKPGQRLDQLVYVQQVRFGDVAEAGAKRLRVHAAANDELGAAALDGLVPLRIADGTVDDPLASPVVWAMRVGAQAAVGWGGDDVALRPRIQAAADQLDDFFDRKEVVAARQAGDDVLSLMRLARERHTTDGPSRPWHVEVWRWRLDGERSLIAGRVCLLRGTDGKPPELVLRATWANLAPVDGVYVLEGFP